VYLTPPVHHPAQKGGFFCGKQMAQGLLTVCLHNFVPAEGWKFCQKTADNAVFWVLLFVE